MVYMPLSPLFKQRIKGHVRLCRLQFTPHSVVVGENVPKRRAICLSEVCDLPEMERALGISIARVIAVVCRLILLQQQRNVILASQTLRKEKIVTELHSFCILELSGRFSRARPVLRAEQVKENWFSD